jgi:hypothetical protein
MCDQKRRLRDLRSVLTKSSLVTFTMGYARPEEGFASRTVILLSGKVMTDESGLFETRSGCEKGRWREPRRDALGPESDERLIRFGTSLFFESVYMRLWSFPTPPSSLNAPQIIRTKPFVVLQILRWKRH